MSDKYPTSMRLSVEARTILAALAQEMGISQRAVLEIALREYARKHRSQPLQGEQEYVNKAGRPGTSTS